MMNINLFQLNDPRSNSVIVCLKEKQLLYLSGVFDVQIVKGGIVYNNAHYSSSKQELSFWHPLSNSIPPIQSSYYAGWEEPLNLGARFRHSIDRDVFNDESFTCILRISNAQIDGLIDAHKLYPDVRQLWKIRENDPYSTTIRTFTILNEMQDQFVPLITTNQWTSMVEKMKMSHKDSTFDIRIIVIGGKNSGKSTFLRLLCENLIHNDEDSFSSQEELLYLDLDPGQPEYSLPDCLSLNEIKQQNPNKTFALGQHFGQESNNFRALKQYYYGSNSPQDNPTTYLDMADQLINYFEEQCFVGTSLLNLPGWVKGFGINIINHVIQKYKPTHIITLESKSNSLINEFNIPNIFSNPLQDDYEPIILSLSAFKTFNDSQARFHAPQIRTYKTLLNFHLMSNHNYDFDPLLFKSPVQISFGSFGIQGIQYMETDFQKLHEDDIKGSLEGTIVALNIFQQNNISEYINAAGTYPMISKKININALKFVTLALIHSIDEKRKIMNLYIPCSNLSHVKSSAKETQWILIRNKTETPFCEVFPPNQEVFFSSFDSVPYLTTKRRKKHEHVWKVRKNVLRRGQLMK
ncbi:hypothetical protein KAFR_0L00270 [Kazachstania africana CBS 2517]|uniref:Polynucleotide 5'-hydroxyl-kinase GRC3 n=1 Tax=Kazachstania africana (strain ATCC 22294 / BCRC 22015 / CBS 2517 / CECT 1963 / NBRC 1671 / NRRL Y-8276) TaxID=1071382 RepID=H2B1Y4_KAZAF|nr:hypothetical protein KAFR_0L00270 [Kazachstania africana CBS 2517]CCF60634.1 hypothetical protein KAFR_0L00270 [Kazachstania africana CBS 2517]